MFKIKYNRSYFDSNINVIAVTKYVSKECLQEYYDNNYRNFGENRVDSFLEKKEFFKKDDIKWHFIGHLQKNKCKKVINEIDYLHSLESIELAKNINKYANKEIKCFIEINISNEENKYGINKEDLFKFYEEVSIYDKIKVIGLMCICENTDNEEVLNNSFQEMNRLLNELNNKFNLELKELSMGMSNDYQIALKNNATYIRIGSMLIEEN